MMNAPMRPNEIDRCCTAFNPCPWTPVCCLLVLVDAHVVEKNLEWRVRVDAWTTQAMRIRIDHLDSPIDRLRLVTWPDLATRAHVAVVKICNVEL